MKACRMDEWRRSVRILVVLAVLATASLPNAALAQRAGDWPSYGYDVGATRYSPLTQITPANVSSLGVAWTYGMLPPPGAMPPPPAPPPGAPPPVPGAPAITPAMRIASQTTPLAIDGVVFISTPLGAVTALDGDSGKVIWSVQLPNGDVAAQRGFQSWAGDRRHEPRLIVPTRQGRYMALSTKTGALIPTFGEGGIVNMKTADVMNGLPNASYGFSSPPAMDGHIIITGSRVQENPFKGAAGDIRGVDARTGKILWTFRTIPGPGEFGYDTWESGSTEQRSGVNVWAQISVDTKRHIAFLPIGAPTYDRYGGDRKGANLFSSSLVAVDTRTGRYLWHFQLTHHDIWDLDMTATPTLIDVRKDGRTIPAVVAMNKAALMFMLDRETGKPIYDVEERPVPPSPLASEQAWPTQPFPSKPPQLARSSFDMSEIATVTPELTRTCKAMIDSVGARGSPTYGPLAAEYPTIHFPGAGGGVEWGSGAYDPKNGYYVVNTNDLGMTEQLVQRPNGTWGLVVPGDNWFMDPKSRMLCQEPPWGSLTAVNVNTGEIAWRRNLGITESLPPGQQDTGRPMIGGPILTASGLTFIGATDDARMRALDTLTGKELWTYKLDYSAHATPITYRGKSGKQYVAIVATGGSIVRSPNGGDSLVVFALR
jgi:quinoprotein glucose dehydrogenase